MHSYKVLIATFSMTLIGADTCNVQNVHAVYQNLKVAARKRLIDGIVHSAASDARFVSLTFVAPGLPWEKTWVAEEPIYVHRISTLDRLRLRIHGAKIARWNMLVHSEPDITKQVLKQSLACRKHIRDNPYVLIDTAVARVGNGAKVSLVAINILLERS